MDFKRLDWKIGTSLEDLKTMLIMENLLHFKGNIKQSCKSLKISRATLYRWAMYNKVNINVIKLQYSGVKRERTKKRSNQMNLPFGR